MRYKVCIVDLATLVMTGGHVKCSLIYIWNKGVIPTVAAMCRCLVTGKYCILQDKTTCVQPQQ